MRDRPLKVTVVGDGNVGKTCLLYVFANNGAFPDTYAPTVYDEFSSSITIDGKLYRLTLWDTAGQEEYDQLRPLTYPNTDVFLLCYAVDNPTSFLNITKKWIPELKRNCPAASIVLVGTKVDKRQGNNDSHITIAAGKQMKSKIKASYFVECSAVRGRVEGHVQQVFEMATKSCLGFSFQQPDGWCKLM